MTRKLACYLLETWFPSIAARYLACKEYMRATYGIEAQFDLFWNFCVNAPSGEESLVRCWPHVDAMNLALGICVLYIYGVLSSHIFN
jgi:hypothetical protein